MLHHHWQWNLKRNSRPGAQPVYDEAASMWVKALALAGISGGLACLLFILSLSSPRAAGLLPALQENSGEVGEHFVLNSNACNVTQRCGALCSDYINFSMFAAPSCGEWLVRHYVFSPLSQATARARRSHTPGLHRCVRRFSPALGKACNRH